jgi:hypothetical protein
MTECIIIGNGPSLKNVSNGALTKLPTFGTNGVLLKFDPTYYVAVNNLAVARFQHLIEKSNATKYLPKGTNCKVPYTHLNSVHVPFFSYDPLRWVYEGYTVTFVCMQLAFMLGFEIVYLLGVDHKYVFEGAPNEERVLLGDDPNHFDPTYFKDAAWNNPDLAQSEASYELALEAFTNDGRQIINCTEGSDLTVFPKGRLPWK